MRIAQVSPLYESVPPKFYGGTERVVHNITEELITRGHEVTLFASGDSETNARLVSPCKRALRMDNSIMDSLVNHFTMMEMVEKEAHNFDIIHSHIDYLYFPIIQRSKKTHVTTLHGRLDIPELQPLYREYSNIPLISISNSQRQPLSNANWKGTVYHGIPLNLYQYCSQAGNYLAFVGRVSPEKRVDRAIEISIVLDIPLKIAAKVDKDDKEYFEKNIKNLLDYPGIEFLGEIGEKEKQELLGNALCFLYPIDWPEPFGLGMIEALACGTPVVAFNCGSVPEVIDHGRTGFIVNSVDEAVDAVKKIHQINRDECRRTFEKRFSVNRMVDDYLKIYESLLNEYKQISVVNF